jgi:hypothetical protein
MAVIDSKKLLPPAKSSGSALATQKFLVPISNIKVKSSAIIRASDIKPVEKPEDGGGKIVLSGVLQIRESVVSIQRLIGSNTTLLQQSEERERKLLEKEKFESKEKRLETRKGLSIPQLNIPSLPKTGFLDAIKRFLFYTLLGAAFVKFGKHIPKILEFSKKLIPAIKFLENFAGNILNGAVEFIDNGYKAYDKVREISKTIGGEDLQKKFDEFSKQFNTFANLAIIAGMSTMGGTDFRRSGGAAGVTGAGASSSLGASKSLGGFGAGTAMTPGRYRLPGQAKAGGDFASQLARKKLTFEQSVAAQQASKQVAAQGAKQSLKSLAAVPIIGALIGFIIDTVIFREKPSRAAAGAVGSAIGQGIGIALAGGTTFGLGAGLGMFVGGFAGDWLGKELYDTVSGYNGKSPEAKAQGGQVTRGGKKVSGPSRRPIKKVRGKPPKVTPQKTIPGKDVGGRKEIEKLFPYSINPNQKSPLGVLETTSESLKKVPLLGGIMGASIDLTMGQKPDSGVFKKIGYGFGALVQNAIDAETSNTISNIQKEIVGLAGGGVVPRTLSTGENIGMKIGERLAKTLEIMMNSKVNETIQSIRQQFSKEGFGLTGSPTTGPTGELATGTLARGQLTIEQLVGLAKGAGFSQSDAVIMAAVAMAESSGNSNSNRTDTDVHGLWQIRFPSHEDKLKRLGITSRDQLYDPVANAAAAKAVYDSQGITAWSAYTNKKYERYLTAARSASSAPAITVYKPTPTGGFVPLGTNTGNLQEISELAAKMGLSKTSGYRPGDSGYHGQGRALDFQSPGKPGNRGTPQQLSFAREIIKKYGKSISELIYTPLGFGIKNGKQVPLTTWGPLSPPWADLPEGHPLKNSTNAIHYDHVHVAFEKGGKVHGLTRAILGEKGPEFVLDANTTASLEQNYPGFLDALNKADYKGALKVLSNYTSYYNPSRSSMIMLQKVIVEKPIPVGGGGMISGGVNNSSASTSPITASLYSA